MTPTDAEYLQMTKKSLNRNDVMKLLLIYIKDFDGLIMNYPNDKKSIYNNGKMNEGVISTKLGLRGIPNISEEIMVDRDISLR